MNKNFFVILSIVLALGLIVALLAILFLPQLSKTTHEAATENIPIDPVPTPTLPVKIKLDLEFDNPDDLKWIQLTNNDNNQDRNSEEAYQQGFFRLGQDNPFTNANMLYNLESGQFAHFRTRVGEQTCAAVGLEVGLPNQSKTIRLGGCTGGLYGGEVVYNRDHFGDSIFGNLPISGSVPCFAEEWVDQLLWLSENGDQLSYLITNTVDPSQIMAGSVSLPQDWQFDRWGFGVSGFFESGQDQSYIEVDLIRVGSGSITGYLAEYLPAYLENQAELERIFEQSSKTFPELLPQQQEGNLPNSNPEIAEGAEGQDLKSPLTFTDDLTEEYPVLTWPEPTTILPYLVKIEDLEKCTNCENTVYGVTLNPYGYVFSAAFGVPPDAGAVNPNTYIKEWIQLFDHPIRESEYLQYFQQNHRIQPYQIGEPIPFLYYYGGEESNLLDFKSNILITASAINAGNNLSTVENIIKNATNQLPETGLETPPLVPALSTKLDQQTAINTLENAWLATYEEPSKPVFSFNDRVNLWVQLNSSVEKLESAIYHPDSQTYLYYAWVDHPTENTPIAMSGIISTVDTKSPNGYYLEKYEGDFLIRVWVDGQLVAEFPVEG